MLVFAYYLAKVILISGLLYSYYLAALRNKKFHQYNRLYLLMTVLLSLILPLIKIEFQQSNSLNAIRYFTVLSNVEIYVKQVSEKPFLNDYNVLACSAYLIISFAVLMILIYQLVKISLLIKNSPKTLKGDVWLVFAEAQKTLYSFFNFIFWDNKIDIDSEEGKCILQHEITHVRQKHTLDKLFLNIVLIGFCANPFFWIIRKELNMVHEFIADENAGSNNDESAFANMLLTVVYPQHKSFLTNSFFHSPIKRRLNMITTSKITPGYFRRALIVPLLAMIGVLSAFRITEKTLKLSKPFSENEAEKSVSDTLKPEARFAGGNDAWRKYLETNLNANVVEKDHAPKGIYQVKIKFTATEKGEIKDVSALEIPEKCPSCALEAVRIIKESPNWTSAEVNGKKVISENIQFISFQKD